MPEFEAILFDFDGVLVNSEDLHFEAFARAGHAAGMTITPDDYRDHVIGFDDRGGWKQLADAKGVHLDNAALLNLMAYKAQVVQEILRERKFTALPGVPELVRGLSRHYPLAIVSGALREEIEIMLEGIALRDCFLTIVAAEDVTEGKPNPEGWHAAVAQLNRRYKKAIRPTTALIFEDAPRSIARAKADGFPTVGVPTQYGHDDLKADFATKSMSIDHVTAAVPGLRVFRE